MSRKISLTRIHALNWYGYRDSFDVAGNLLVAGVTGSGKSVLMDLVQFVLVGDQRKTRYNQSATGERSTRDLIGYCLGDLKHEINGARQYMRPRGGITYVALEFTWPDGERVETWGMRIEFDSAARSTPSRMEGFYLPASLKRSDFLHEDAEGRRPLDWAAFKQLVATPRGEGAKVGAIFPTLDAYRREMALPSHLNFDRTTLDYLLPAAMSFTFMDNFNKFCREFILPAEGVDIQSVKDSYRVFRNLQSELALMREQLERLQRIEEFAQTHAAAHRDRLVTRHLEAELRRDATQERVELLQKQQAELDEALAGERVRENELKELIETVGGELSRLETAMRETEEGRLYRHLQEENRRLVGRMQRLREIGTKAETALKTRAQKGIDFAERALALPFRIEPGVVETLRTTVETLEATDPGNARPVLHSLAEAVRAVLRDAQRAIAPKQRENDELEKEWAHHRGQLEALRQGRLSENTVLLDAINARLPEQGGEPAAHALWQLCEVTDEQWRPALEVSFGRKFAVVVEPRDYEEAERVYHELRGDAPGESLVNAERVLAQRAHPARGSLAEKIEAAHPVARAVIDNLFGDVICVTRLDELRKHPRAIMPDGFQIRGIFAERPRHYDNRPCIGHRGLDRRKAWLQQKMEEIRERQQLLEPALQAWREFQNFASQTRLDSETIDADLNEAALLPEFERQLEGNIKSLGEIRSEDLEEKERRVVELRNQLESYRREERGIISSDRRHRLSELRREVEEALAMYTRMEDRFREISLQTDISAHDARTEEIRAELLAASPMKMAAADECRDRFHIADKLEVQSREALTAVRRELAASPTYGSRFSSFDPESEDNAPWRRQLEKIQAGDIPEYEKKAKSEERNWQQLFRTQVLEKLREKLLDVETLMALLETQLREPIGNSRYRIKAVPNPDDEYVLYRRLLDAAAVARPDEFLFANADAEVREAVDNLFTRLIDRADDPQALAFLDYRNYFDYDMLVMDLRDAEAKPSSLNKHSGKFSGGENQTPYFIAILACYLRAYQRHSRRRGEPSLSIVPIDEAFSKLSGERIRDCISALHKLDLQGVFSMSSGNIPYAIDQVDQVISVSAQPERRDGRKMVRNVAVTLTRADAHQRFSR